MIDLRVEAPGAGPMVLGDPVLLEWALEALVKNAIDALQGRDGDHHLPVGADRRMGAIRVSDDGPGFRATFVAPCSSPASRPSAVAGASASRSHAAWWRNAHGGKSRWRRPEQGASFRDSRAVSRPATMTERLALTGCTPSIPAQREAVEHVHGPLLVLAGAGSGKTRVLTTRIAALIDRHGVPPERIFAVTFTNKAAGEMKQRIGQLLERDPSGLWIGTFHSLSARLLRREAELLGFTRQFTIYDEDDRLSLIRRLMEQHGHSTKLFPPRVIQAMISSAKNRMTSPSELAAASTFDRASQVAADVYTALGPALRGQRDGFRRPDAAPADAVPGASRSAGVVAGPLRLHAGGRIPGHQPGPVRAGAPPRAGTATSARWATTISRSMAGAAPTCATCRTS